MKFFSKITTFEQKHPILALFPIVIPRIILENLYLALQIGVEAIVVSIYMCIVGSCTLVCKYLSIDQINSLYSAFKFLIKIPLTLIYSLLLAAWELVLPTVVVLTNAVTTILYMPIKQTVHNLSVPKAGPEKAYSLYANDGGVLMYIRENFELPQFNRKTGTKVLQQ